MASLTPVSAPAISAGLRAEWLASHAQRDLHRTIRPVGFAATSPTVGLWWSLLGSACTWFLWGVARRRTGARSAVPYRFDARGIKRFTLLAAKARKAVAKPESANSNIGLHSPPGLPFKAHKKTSRKISSTLWATGYLERMERFRRLAAIFPSSPDRRKILNALLHAAEPVAAVSAVTVRLRNRKTGILDAIACKNLDEREWKETFPRGAIGLSKIALQSGKPVMILDVSSHASARHVRFLRKYGLASYFGVPLAIEGKIIGVIGYFSALAQGFSRDEMVELTTLSGLSSVALHNALLREENAAQALDLRRAAVTVEKSDKAKTDFLSVMSHEFRTPLNLIMGYAGMMQEGLLGELNDEQKRGIDRVMQCSDDLLRMIISILQASGIEAGSVRLEQRNLAARELIEVLKTTCAVPAGKQVELVWRCADELPALRTDPEKLKQVLEHLIDNAIKFTDRGRIVISVSLTADAGAIEFAVADTGIGIVAEALPDVFEMFRQSDSSITRSHGGVGLGLYLAKKFVDLLAGELRVESKVNEGSIFTVTLPRNL